MNSGSLSREWRLLLACAKLSPSAADRQSIENEIAAVDWDRFIALACEHDLAPLAYRTIQKLEIAVTHAVTLGKLKSLYLGNAMRNALLFRELGLVLLALEREGKPVILLKGAALADTVYQNRALRPMSDLDVLVKKEDVLEVGTLLTGLGYILDERSVQGGTWDDPNRYHLVYKKPVRGAPSVCCEVHWHLERPSRPFHIDLTGVWNRAVPATIMGADVLILSPADLLLYLCLHTSKHRLTGGFRAFCDIAETVRHYRSEMDWEQLLTRASEWRINTFVYVPLRLAVELLGAPVPEQFLKNLLPRDFDLRLFDAATEEVLEDRLSGTLFPDLFRLSGGRGFRERTAIVRRIFSRDSVRYRYSLPEESNTLRYYPRRLKDLVASYGPELWRFLRRGRKIEVQAKQKSLLSEWLAPFSE